MFTLTFSKYKILALWISYTISILNVPNLFIFRLDLTSGQPYSFHLTGVTRTQGEVSWRYVILFLHCPPSHMQLKLNLKIQVFEILNLFHGSIALHFSAYSATLKCFEIVIETAALLYAVILRVNKLQSSSMRRICRGMFFGDGCFFPSCRV
jgi:hypothetical protein